MDCCVEWTHFSCPPFFCHHWREIKIYYEFLFGNVRIYEKYLSIRMDTKKLFYSIFSYNYAEDWLEIDGIVVLSGEMSFE